MVWWETVVLLVVTRENKKTKSEEVRDRLVHMNFFYNESIRTGEI